MTTARPAPTTIATARALLAAGWSPIPLPAAAKWPPPNGVTGWRGRYTTTADLSRTGWDWTGNLAIRLPRDVAGVDVDAYNGGSLDDLEARFGPLPATVWSTSRDDGSGIALFRVPNGTVLATNPATGVDIIQFHHRYAVCAPSINPKTEARYRWIDEQSGEVVDGPPEPGELPELPWAWIDGLAMDKMAGAHAVAPAEADTFINTHTNSTRPAALKGLSKRLEAVVPGGRHDALIETSCWAMREAAAGYYPANDAIELLHRWWIGAVADDPARREGGEFGAAILWAIGQAGADPERIQAIRDRPHPHSDAVAPPDSHEAAADPETPETSSTGATGPQGVDPETGEIRRCENLPDEFWRARPILTHIRQAAQSRMVAPEAVLVNVIARTATLIPPSHVLPAVIGDQATLDFIGSVIADTSGGKSASAGVARQLLPAPPAPADPDEAQIMMDAPIGSGEGIAQAFMVPERKPDDDGKPKATGRQVVGRQAVHLVADEGTAFLAQTERKGTTIVGTLASAWSGAPLGALNADKETRRLIEGGRVRVCAVINMQASNGWKLFAENLESVGFPGRVLFATAHNPNAPDPDELPDWPGPIEWDPPPHFTYSKVTFEYAPEIVREIREVRHGVLTKAIAIEKRRSQYGLLHCKVAAVLAAWARSRDVTVEDWELARQVIDASTAVLDRLAAIKIEHDDIARVQAARRRGEAEAIADDVRERRAVAKMAKRIEARVTAEGIGRSALTRSMSNANTRPTFETALERVINDGLVELVESTGNNVGEIVRRVR